MAGDVIDFAPEIALDVEHQRRAVLCQHLLQKRIDGACGLAAADATEDNDVLACIGWWEVQARDWSPFRSFAGAKAKPLPTQPAGEKAMYSPPSGPGYFPETREERQRSEEAAAGERLLQEQDATRTDELWERMERERQEREEKERGRDHDHDIPGF